MSEKEIVLSGIRATGKLHLGNYLGAMKNFVNLSRDKDKQCFFFIANLHTITTRIDPKSIMDDLLEIVLNYLAVGIDPDRSTIFAQSSVPETCELAWMLNCLTTVAELERMPHFKEKKDKLEEKEMANSGLLTYPILMAADILGPGADLVPVGEDQHPHVELARTLARRFNSQFGETFTTPEILSSEAVRVPGLDGTGKMGKSDNNTIDLTDTPEVVKEKLRIAVTDTNRQRLSDPGDPSICNIYTLHTILSSNDEIKETYIGCRNARIGCVDCKNILAKNIINVLAPIQQKRSEFQKKGKSFITEILHEDGKKARQKIAPRTNEAKEKMGIPFY